jgi:molybdate transport system substrate-binding protein
MFNIWVFTILVCIIWGEIMRKELIILLVLLSVSLAIGCAGNESEAPNATVTPVTPGTAGPETITVSAAASLTEAFTDIASQFEKENNGTNVSLNFASSGNLRKQIEGGAPVDVFASADETQMNILANKSLIDNSSREDFAINSLVLIVPAKSTLNITRIQDLTDPKVQKIGIGNPDTVPVGNYTRTALTEANVWSQLENKTVLAEDVKQVLTYVERGEVDAGFVYITDAKTAKPGTIKVVTNVSVSTPVTYPIAVVSSSEHKEKAQKFLDFVTGKEGQEILKRYGFVPQS